MRFFKGLGCTVEFLDEKATKDDNEELVQDVLSLFTCFSARLYGKRGGRPKGSKNKKKLAATLEIGEAVASEADDPFDEGGFMIKLIGKCPCCNQVSGGKTFGNEWSNFRDLIYKTWQEGMKAALLDMSINRENCRIRCPYGPLDDIVVFHAWVGGAYHGMCWRHERPDEVAKWLLENDQEDKAEHVDWQKIVNEANECHRKTIAIADEQEGEGGQ